MEVSIVKSKRSFFRRHREDFKSYGLLAIPLVWWVVFFVVPVIMALVISFSNMKAAFVATQYGIFQYVAVLKDPLFFESLGVTFIWTFVMMVGNNLFGFLTAYMIHRLAKGRRFFLTLLFWPYLVSAVASAGITKSIFGPSSNNLMNMLIKLVGIAPVAWLDQQSTALIAIMAMPFFFGFSVKMIIYYAGLLSIPKEYYEAARLETNSTAAVMFHITLPLVKNMIVLNLLLSVIDGIKVMGPMMLITNGNFGTTSVVYYIYQNAFYMSAKGKACAAAFLVFLIILVLSLIQLKLSGKKGETYG